MRWRIKLNEDYWHKTEGWQHRVNMMIWVFYVFMIAGCLLNPNKWTFIINGFGIIASLPAKITYDRWEKRRLRKELGLETEGVK